MANNYYQATGALNLKKITPVISALFGVFDVQEYGEGQAYIKMDDDQSMYYSSVADSIVAEMGIDPLDSVNDYIIAMAEKVGKEAEVKAFLGGDSIDAEEIADLDFLFHLAQLMDDGHGLTSLWSEGAWTCDKLRLGEFGGNGEFSGKNFTFCSGSSTATQLGEVVNNALADSMPELAANHIELYLQGMLNGIRDESARNSVTALLVNSLQKRSNICTATVQTQQLET